MDEPGGHMARSGPSVDSLRGVLMGHVAVKVLVATDLEKGDLAVVRHVPVGFEAANGRFQILNIRRPRVTEKVVSCRDTRFWRHLSTPWQVPWSVTRGRVLVCAG